MKCYFNNDSVDPYYNFAIGYFFAKHNVPVFILWRNKGSILLGKNQNIYRKINLEYAEENGTNLVRKSSGGRCVYTDEKNMQYTFIESQNYANDFKHFASMIINQVKRMGLNPEFSGRNDILIDGKKISDNAQYMKNSMVVHRGTILLDIGVEKMMNSLTPQEIKFEGKATKSVESRITTIDDMIDMEYDEFFNKIRNGIVEDNNLEECVLNGSEKEEVNKYINLLKNEEFTYSKGETTANYQRKHKFGVVKYSYSIKDNLIDSLKIGGDFFSNKDISEFCDMFVGKAVTIDGFHNVLKDANIRQYIVGMDEKVFLDDIPD